MKRFILNLFLFAVWVLIWYLITYYISTRFLGCNAFAINAVTAVVMMLAFASGLQLFGRW